jgi:hypothetical protein
MRNGLVVVIARAHDARSAARPADSAGVRCQLPTQAPRPGSGDTMNAFPATDRRARMIAPAPGPGRQQLTPAVTGVG